MDLHHGKISVISPGEGYGSTFTVEFPLHRRLKAVEGKGDERMLQCKYSEDLEVVVNESSRNICSITRRASLVPGNALRVLVVDDVVLNRKMLRNLLKTRCGLIGEASNGEEAMACVAESIHSHRPYHVVLMDNQMPGKSGPEAAYEMRHSLGYKGIIVGVTGYAGANDVEDYMNHGADCVLQKPLDVDALDRIFNGKRVLSSRMCCVQS